MVRNVRDNCNADNFADPGAGEAGEAGDCFKGGDHMICLPVNYQKYDLPLHQEPVRVFIEVHIKDIPKV